MSQRPSLAALQLSNLKHEISEYEKKLKDLSGYVLTDFKTIEEAQAHCQHQIDRLKKIAKEKHGVELS